MTDTLAEGSPESQRDIDTVLTELQKITTEAIAAITDNNETDPTKTLLSSLEARQKALEAEARELGATDEMIDAIFKQAFSSTRKPATN